MYETLLQDFHYFVEKIRGITFQQIQKKFMEKETTDPLSKFVGRYVPQLIRYQQQFDLHSQHKDLKKTLSFDKKRTYNNTDNLHRQIISIFKSFLISQLQDFRQYLRLTVDLDQLSKLLSNIKVLSESKGEFKLIYYLFSAGKRSIRLFMRLRDEVLKEKIVDKNSFLPTSIHNPSKYVQKERYLQQIAVSRKKKQWEHLVTIAGFEYNDQFAQIAFNNYDQVSAYQFIQYCLWINRQAVQSSPKK